MASIWLAQCKFRFRRHSCEDICGGPTDSWKTVINSWSSVEVDFCVSSWRVGWQIYGSSAISQIRGFLLSSCWDFELLSLLKLKESMSIQRSWPANILVAFIFLILCLSLPLLPKHTASPPSFSKSPLKALLKARSGSEVTLECKPQASPPAISLWKKGNEILQRTER